MLSFRVAGLVDGEISARRLEAVLLDVIGNLWEVNPHIEWTDVESVNVSPIDLAN